MITYLVKPGELVLKGGNKKMFEAVLRRNLALRLKGSGAVITTARGRWYVTAPDDMLEKTEFALSRLLGISGWARARVCAKESGALFNACAEEARGLAARGVKTFKVEARRTDKSFPLDSYQICCEAGDAVTGAFPSLSVDVKNPESVIQVEIRERAFVYAVANKGLMGLPVGSAGRGLVLLSGGIDSPVAAYLMARRGMRVEAVYFHAYPYTSDEARKKVVSLAGIAGAYTMGIRLHTVGFTPVQLRIKEKAPSPWTTVLLRMAMMECSELLARREKIKCLITGESLSQVASQTVENIAAIESRLSLPVLRPLIGMDKDDIITMARTIGTYDTSILPYEDCCVIFSPSHPVLRATVEEANRLYESLDASALITEALNGAAVDKCGFA
ncbi:MAG: tRNA 4-thiouridine(8) synthase ThiI [Spirochaetaceae bacterium]|jgi:thiamine biosynthesis protein ThiI|nr:tRNA 4-thiouridine(8) synthase ThiI [Spirochaetaceae bacterium]